MLSLLAVIITLSLASLDSFESFSYSSSLLAAPAHFLKKIEIFHLSSATDTALEFETDIGPEVTPTPLLTIRQALIHELINVVSLRVDAFYPELKHVTSFHMRILEKLRYRADQGAVCLIAILNDKIVPRLHLHMPSLVPQVLGSVEISPSDFRNTTMESIGHERKLYAMDLAVRSGVRRMGIATHLLNAAEAYALQNSYQEIYLHVETDNEAARNLYRKNGYIEVPQTESTLSFTKQRLHKPPDCYVLLWKQIF